MKTEVKDALIALKSSIDGRLNDHLCGMKPNYDDSITGFNEAWDIVRKSIDARITIEKMRE